MRRTISIIMCIGLLGAALTFSGCSKEEKTLAGVGIGAGTGALIGSAAGGTKGGLAGAAIGGVAGGLIGHSLGDDEGKK